MTNVINKKEDIREILQEIIDSGQGTIIDGLLIVRNPDFRPDDGSNLNLVCQISDIIKIIDDGQPIPPKPSPPSSQRVKEGEIPTYPNED